MGFNLALNLKDNGVEVKGFDVSDDARQEVEKHGISSVQSLAELVEALETPRVIWMMVPSGEATESTISQVLPLLEKDDILIDAGNSNYKDSIRHGEEASNLGVRFLDLGTSPRVLVMVLA